MRPVVRRNCTVDEQIRQHVSLQYVLATSKLAELQEAFPRVRISSDPDRNGLYLDGPVQSVLEAKHRAHELDHLSPGADGTTRMLVPVRYGDSKEILHLMNILVPDVKISIARPGWFHYPPSP